MTDGPSRRQARAPAGLAAMAAQMAALEATLAGQGSRLTEIGQDAREARDTVRELNAVLSNENLSGRIEKAREEASQATSVLRADYVSANGGIRRDIEALDERVDRLEAAKDLQGGAALLRTRMATLILSGLAAFGAVAEALLIWIQHK